MDGQEPKLKRARADDPVPQALAVSHRVPGLVLKDRFIRVPLDYSGKVGLTAVKVIRSPAALTQGLVGLVVTEYAADLVITSGQTRCCNHWEGHVVMSCNREQGCVR